MTKRKLKPCTDPLEVALLLEEVERVAHDQFDGHLTIYRFTTHWKVAWGSSYPEQRMHVCIKLEDGLRWMLDHREGSITSVRSPEAFRGKPLL